jgi:hypothetical protein
MYMTAWALQVLMAWALLIMNDWSSTLKLVPSPDQKFSLRISMYQYVSGWGYLPWTFCGIILRSAPEFWGLLIRCYRTGLRRRELASLAKQ